MAKKRNKKQTKSPLNKISREIPLVIGIIFLIVLSFFVFKPKSPGQQLKEGLIKNPNDQTLYLKLIRQLISQGEIETAEQALLIAQSKFTLNGELEKLWQEKTFNDPQELRKFISAWESFVKQKPDYRDGFLKLAFFYHQLGEKQKALENLRKAKLLDPNYPGIKKMEELISQP